MHTDRKGKMDGVLPQIMQIRLDDEITFSKIVLLVLNNFKSEIDALYNIYKYK